MSTNTLKTRIRHAVKTESDWASLNPVLLSGEIAYNSDNDKYKVGNGTSTWSQLSYKIPVTKSDIGLGNVENKSSATIRGELTKDNVTKALGYTPPTTNTTYGVATSSALGLVKSGTDITVDSSGNVSVKDDSHNHIISNIDGLQSSLDTKATKTTLTNQDLNSIVTPGFYNAGGGNTVANKPSGVNNFGLIVIHRASGSYYTQILFDDTSSYRRFCVNGNWGGWTQDKLTDTNTWRGIQNNLTSDSTTDSLSAAQGKVLKSLVDTKSASGHTHDDRYYTESEINTKLNTKLNTSLKGAASGLAELDSTGRVPSSQLPSYVDDVIEGYLYNSKFYKESSHTTQITGETGKIYVDLTSNKTYRWSGSAFAVISETLALGETSTTAYRGDRGKIAYDHSQVAHAPSNAEVNQNAFSNVTVGSTTIAADSKTDTLTLVAGSNVTLTPDATNDRVTISSTNTDTKVTQTAVTSSEYTNWRPLIWGASNSGTEGFTPTTVTDGTFTANTISCQPSTGTIRASVFKGNLSGNATSATTLATARTINGTSFNGSTNITTANWGTSRTITIGNTGKSVNGSGNVSWSLNEIGALPRIIGYYGSDEANTSGWYKVCTVSQSGYSDYSMNLLITQGYIRQATGMLHIHTRCDNSTTITLQSLKWMYRYGFNAEDVKVVTGDNTWSLYIMNTNTRYGRIQVQVISKSGTSGDTSFTLSNNTTKESSEPSGTSATDGGIVNYANSSGKWATARTLSLTGAVTGSASIDGSGNVSLSTSVNHTHNYLPLSGGALTGLLTLKGNVYEDAYTGALNANNSNIYGVNSLIFADLSDSAGEGIQFYRDSSHVDSLWGSNGVLYWTPNRPLGDSGTNYTIYHSGNLTKSILGLGNVENKSSATIRSEITSSNVTTALGFTPSNSNHTHNYLPISGGTMNGSIKFNSSSLPQKTLSYICGIDAFADGGEMGWQSKDEFLSGCSKTGHTHNYAGSSSAGGSATSAVKLDSSAGSATHPIYFSGGKPVACTYTLGKSVPSDAVFTDTKNTAGSTDTSSKIFLIGATSQAANPQTYSDNEVYTTSGVLTTKSVRVGGGLVTLQYNSSTESLDFVFS